MYEVHTAFFEQVLYILYFEQQKLTAGHKMYFHCKWQSKIFCTLPAQSPYYKRIRVSNWKSGNCEGDEFTFFYTVAA